MWLIDVSGLCRDIWEWERKIRNVKGLRWETGKGCSQKKKKGEALREICGGDETELNKIWEWGIFVWNRDKVIVVGKSSLLFER